MSDLSLPVHPPGWRARLAATWSALRLEPARLLATVVAAAVVLGLGGVLLLVWRGAPPPAEIGLPRAPAPPEARQVERVAAGGGPSRPAYGGAGGEAEVGADNAGASAPGLQQSETPAEVAVHAAGAVAHPGVYRLPAGARVADLLQAAGGPGPGAEVDRLNLAARLADGERLYVPRAGEVVPPVASGPGSQTGSAGQAAASAGGGPIDLNTATLEQLDTLPGVGPATAQAILDYRGQQGRFRSVQELLEVRGIGEAKLAALRAKVRV